MLPQAAPSPSPERGRAAPCLGLQEAGKTNSIPTKRTAPLGRGPGTRNSPPPGEGHRETPPLGPDSLWRGSRHFRGPSRLRARWRGTGLVSFFGGDGSPHGPPTWGVPGSDAGFWLSCGLAVSGHQATGTAYTQSQRPRYGPEIVAGSLLWNFGPGHGPRCCGRGPLRAPRVGASESRVPISRVSSWEQCGRTARDRSTPRSRAGLDPRYGPRTVAGPPRRRGSPGDRGFDAGVVAQPGVQGCDLENLLHGGALRCD